MAVHVQNLSLMRIDDCPLLRIWMFLFLFLYSRVCSHVCMTYVRVHLILPCLPI